jgi:hypothetical protein
MQITEEMIRTKAYELWEANGKPEGAAEQNWFAAKAMLLKNKEKPSRKKQDQAPPIGLRQLTPP